YSPLGSYTLILPRAMTCRPSSALNFSERTADLNITALSCAPASFSVKYRWPVFHSRQLEISPSIQISAYVVSSRLRIPAVASLTVYTVRGARRSRASGAATGSSSNGRSNSELIQILGGVTHSANRDGFSRRFVCRHTD